MKRLIQNVLLMTILMIGLKAHSQSYTLSDSLFEDSLYVNGYYDHSMYLQNNTNNKMVIVWNVIENTLDTANWEILFCFYPECLSNIPSGGTCDTIKPNEEVYMTGLAVSAGTTPKDCNLKIEYYDISNPSRRDTANFIMHASSTDKAPKQEPDAIADTQIADRLNVYPNPALDRINIELKSISYSWKLVDVYGRNVKESVVTETTDLVEIDSSDLPVGMYVLEVNTGKGNTIQKRIIKQ